MYAIRYLPTKFNIYFKNCIHQCLMSVMAFSHSIACIPAGLVFTQLAIYLKACIWFECTDTTEIPLLSLLDVSDSSQSSSLPAKYSVISASKARLSGHASQRKGTSLVRT